MDPVKTRLAVVIPKTECSKAHKTADIRNFFASTTAPRRVPSLSSPSSSPTTISEKKKKKKKKQDVKDKTSKRPMAQLMLDLSNRPTTQICQECGMSFVIGVDEDMSLHKKHHRRVVDGVEWPMAETDGVCRVVWRSSSEEMGESKIVKVNLEPRQLKRSGYKAKVDQILEMVNRSLDAQDLTADQLAASVLYLYLGKHSSSDHSSLLPSKKRRLNISSSGGLGKLDDKKKKNNKEVVKAMCVAARIEHGYQIVRGPDSGSGEQQQLDDGELLRFGETTCELFCSPKPEKALVGIHRIWSAPQSRRTGYARRLLDAVADTFIYGMPITGVEARREAVAFSQPTESGMRLAAAWFRTVLFKIFMD